MRCRDAAASGIPQPAAEVPEEDAALAKGKRQKGKKQKGKRQKTKGN